VSIDDSPCSWLHKSIRQIPIVKYPFSLDELPARGIYFFYEQGENSVHKYDGNMAFPRIVRIGTHWKNNFRKRISEHFLIKESKMIFGKTNPKPSDRSIFRKNIGRALLNKKKNEEYLKVWNIDFTNKENREKYKGKRDIEKEIGIENEITLTLREKFSFRVLSFEVEEKRIGKKGMESRLIGTVASCEMCRPSETWLGHYSPIFKISNGKLWLTQHVGSTTLLEGDREEIEKLIPLLSKIFF
jgi:hypothetical protein